MTCTTLMMVIAIKKLPPPTRKLVIHFPQLSKYVTLPFFLGNKLVHMATYTWQQQPVHCTKGVHKHKCITQFPHICECLCILAQHHMLLQDEDIRNLNLSDVFATLNCKSANGSTWACGLTFCLQRGKTNKKGAMLYATAFCHKDFHHCTVGAFAFYMLERFMVCNQDLFACCEFLALTDIIFSAPFSTYLD